MCCGHRLTETIFFLVQCSFRHCLAARQTDVVCEKWIQKKCTDISCCKRHPKLMKQQSGRKKKRNDVLAITCRGRKFFSHCVKLRLCMSRICYVTQYLSHNHIIGHFFPYKLSLLHCTQKENKTDLGHPTYLFFFFSLHKRLN